MFLILEEKLSLFITEAKNGRKDVRQTCRPGMQLQPPQLIVQRKQICPVDGEVEAVPGS